MGFDKETDLASNGDHHNVDLESPTGDREFNLAGQHEQLERGLKSRHIQFLALGEAQLPHALLPTVLWMRRGD